MAVFSQQRQHFRPDVYKVARYSRRQTLFAGSQRRGIPVQASHQRRHQQHLCGSNIRPPGRIVTFRPPPHSFFVKSPCLRDVVIAAERLCAWGPIAAARSPFHCLRLCPTWRQRPVWRPPGHQMLSLFLLSLLMEIMPVLLGLSIYVADGMPKRVSRFSIIAIAHRNPKRFLQRRCDDNLTRPRPGSSRKLFSDRGYIRKPHSDRFGGAEKSQHNRNISASGLWQS